MNPKVSIIVPVYKVEKFLNQCVQSILRQTLSDIEIILVDDGGTDKCPDMIDEFAQNDSRVVALHQKNSGYGKAMNYGISVAKGKYIGIVESDDWIDDNMYEDLYMLAEKNNAQVVKSSFYNYKDGISKKNYFIKEEYNNCLINPEKDQFLFLALPSIWSSLYSREFLFENKIYFNETPGASFQDLSFYFKVFSVAKRVFITTNAYVHYRMDNPNSSTYDSGKVFCVSDEFEEIESFLQDRNITNIYCCVKNYKKFITYLWNFNRLSYPYNKLFYKKFIEELHDSYTKKEIDFFLFTSKERKIVNRMIHHPKYALFRLLTKNGRWKRTIKDFFHR